MEDKEINKNSVMKTFGTYKGDDVTILLKDVTDLVKPVGTEEKERMIQSGIHYSELLQKEWEPSSEYLRLFEEIMGSFSPVFAPVDTDLKNRKLKYIASSTIDPLNYEALIQSFGMYYDEYHTFNQEKNIVCLSGLRMPFSTVQSIGDSVDSIAADLAKSVNEEDDNPLAGKSNDVFSNLRAGKPRKRIPKKMVSIETTNQDTGEKRERKISSRRRDLLERYGGRK